MREPSPCACLSSLGAKTRARARTTSHLTSSVTYSSLDGSQAATNSLYLLSFRRRSAGLFYLPDRVPLHPLFVDRRSSNIRICLHIHEAGVWYAGNGLGAFFFRHRFILLWYYSYLLIFCITHIGHDIIASSFTCFISLHTSQSVSMGL